MSAKINIAVIFGGRSGEHEVSVMSARSVLAALDPQKYNISAIGITHDGAWIVGDHVLEAFEANDISGLSQATLLPRPGVAGIYTYEGTLEKANINLLTPVDVVFPVLHGTFGEDGTIQGLLELADVAYVGAGVLGSSVGMDKALFKDVMRANHVPVVDSVVFTRLQLSNQMNEVLAHSEAISSYPLFVKPANLGSSVGITRCRNRSDLIEGLMDAARYDRRILVEKGINAREIEISVLGNEDPRASVPGEVLPADDFYSYAAKYLDDRSRLLIPAPLEPEVVNRIQSLALKAFKAIDCAGMARVDFLLDRDSGELFLGEVNTIPGFTSISMYAKLWQASGLPYPALVDRLVELALDRKADRDRTEHRYGRTG